MRLLPLIAGMALGLAAIVLAWTRAPRGSAPGVAGPPPPAAAQTAPPSVAQAVPPAAPNSTGPEGGALPAAAPVYASDLDQLRARGLLLPVEGVGSHQLRDDFADPRRAGTHEALDILAPRGTRVLATEDGFVAKLFTSARGGLTVYQFDRSQTWCYYYAHLDRYAPGLREGKQLRRGDLVGFVGTTGNAPPQTPHLHFAIFKLGPERRWWQGTPVNPFAVWAGRG